MQWIRRCKVEELNLVDSYAGPKAVRIQQAFSASTKPSFYPTPDRMTLSKHRVETLSKAEETKKQDNDNLDTVSKVSAMTPMTQMSQEDRVSSVSKQSKQSFTSKTTTQSTKMRMEALQGELEAERKRRILAEKEVESLRATQMK